MASTCFSDEIVIIKVKSIIGIFFMLKSFPVYRQLDSSDCGPTCLKIIAKYYGREVSLEFLREKCYITKEGVTILGISEAAESIGLHSFATTIDYDTLAEDVPLPCIAYWRQRHFVVVYKIKKDVVYLADPGYGLLKRPKEEFMEGWLDSRTYTTEGEGILLLFEPTPQFYEDADDQATKPKKGLNFILPYFRPYKSYLVQLLLGMIVGNVIQLAFPFLTQALVDIGIKNQDIGFIYLVLIAQLMLFFSQSAVEVIRGWLLLYLGSRINISILSDYLIKFMRLPLAFFDSREPGDLYQRIQDNSRIENFLSSTSLTFVFSAFTLIVFSVVLAYYSLKIFTVFWIGSILYGAWVLFFMKRRARLDYKRFEESKSNASSLIQLIYGMLEIKLNNSEKRRRWEWEAIRIRLHRVAIKGLLIQQYQYNGGVFISELKNILITFIAVMAVLEGSMTLGMLLALQYIIGQLNVPLNDFVTFIQQAQDAKMSLERLAEVHTKEDEQSVNETKIRHLPNDKSISLNNDVCFRYGGPGTPYILKDLNLDIPEGKVTAIVGASGSGKTTLLKLLLKFYAPQQGSIQVGNVNLEHIDTTVWRTQCGAVMQDGFIFADTIARNISESKSEGLIDREQLVYAVQVANIEDHIESIPNGYNTKIGKSGVNLSAGQSQRVLIARAVYKNPQYLFFDEATSALDANNEKVILENLERFCKGKTVVVIAHRLSTVKSADQIVVLDQGRIIETGTHETLSRAKGAYYTLVKNQLELGL